MYIQIQHCPEGQRAVAFLPTAEMSAAVAPWERGVADVMGTHPYCSFVGMMMWQQALDLLCPAGLGDAAKHLQCRGECVNDA